MSESTVYIAAPPEKVFEQLTKAIDEAEPGPLKVGNQFRIAGENAAFTVTLVEPPSRFGYSVLTGDVTTTAEYTVLPEGGGSQVRVEMHQDSPSSPLFGMLIGAFIEGKTEEKMLAELRTRVEAATAD